MPNVHRIPTVSVTLSTIVGVALSLTAAPACHAAAGLGDAIFEALEDKEIKFQASGLGIYNHEELVDLGLLALAIVIDGSGDPFLEYTLTVTNNGAEPGTLFYGIAIDIQPLPPGDPDFQMRSTLQYSVADNGGDGSAMLVPDPFSGLQAAVLSDDRTNFVSDLALSLGFDVLSEPGQAPPSDTGLLPLLDVPPLAPGVTIDTYGVMGLRGLFELSAGDTAVITGRFEIIPEPATLALTLVGSVLVLPFRPGGRP